MRDELGPEDSALNRITDKLEEIEEYLGDLMEMVPKAFEEYSSDVKARAACERYFEKIVEASVDLAFLVLNYKDFEMPEDEESAFKVLADNKAIAPELSAQLSDFKGMRNIIAHKYGEIDDSRVYLTLSEEVERDIGEYLNSIRRYLEIDQDGDKECP